jgi:DNA-binding beta-propeller fold protein YncE
MRALRSSLLLGLALSTAALAAEAVRLRPLASVYVDGQGAALREPHAVAFGAGLLAVADSGGGRVLVFSVAGESVSPKAVLASPEVPFPTRVAVLGSGQVLALDGRTRRIARFSPEGAFAGWLEPSGVEGAVSARSLAAQGERVFVLDVAGPRVLVLDAGGKLEAALPVPREAGFVSDVAVDGKGDLYAVDSVSRRLWVARKGEPGFSALTEPMPDEMEFPTAIAADEEGRLFVADEHGGGVVVFGRDGAYRGRQLAMGWRDGFLRYPSGLAAGPGGLLFVADRGNNRVQLFGTR